MQTYSANSHRISTKHNYYSNKINSETEYVETEHWCLRDVFTAWNVAASLAATADLYWDTATVLEWKQICRSYTLPDNSSQWLKWAGTRQNWVPGPPRIGSDRSGAPSGHNSCRNAVPVPPERSSVVYYAEYIKRLTVCWCEASRNFESIVDFRPTVHEH